MSIFRPDYNKPGKGVEKDEPEKNELVKFLTLFYRKWTNFIILNLIFAVPMVITVGLIFLIYMLPYFCNFSFLPAVSINGEVLNVYNMYVVPLPIVFLSPFFGGVVVVIRRLVERQYVFVWEEYIEGVKDNWKQFLASASFSYLFFVVLSFSFIFYSGKLEDGVMYYVPFVIVSVLLVLLTFAQIYVPILIVCVYMKLKNIYINSLIFSAVGFVRNLIVVLSFASIGYIIYLAVGNALGFYIVCMLFIAVIPIFLIYILVYVAYPVVYQNAILPMKKQEEDNNVEADDEDGEENPMFINGRLVTKDDVKKLNK